MPKHYANIARLTRSGAPFGPRFRKLRFLPDLGPWDRHAPRAKPGYITAASQSSRGSFKWYVGMPCMGKECAPDPRMSTGHAGAGQFTMPARLAARAVWPRSPIWPAWRMLLLPLGMSCRHEILAPPRRAFLLVPDRGKPQRAEVWSLATGRNDLPQRGTPRRPSG